MFTECVTNISVTYLKFTIYKYKVAISKHAAANESRCLLYDLLNKKNVCLYMKYSKKEIEHFLYLYPIMIKKRTEIDELLNYSILDKRKKESLLDDKLFYDMIYFRINSWLQLLENEELELIKYRYFDDLNYELIAFKLNYSNHSSMIKKLKKVIKKLERRLNEDE